ncbi:aspartic proteinase CDR1 [Cajanus cajan]|uniref:Aspartic proteinase nepenthesin-2 n=1 Tax=Cajanus cajan TaxID=3821 RepID=A0A151T9L5_CAJCA|nr:aspartic proteinase CDR1 [Cajanus cajan]KYP63725.1 Aspartic proteinase nepenthesin-2 [Cajanus cajan]
MYAFIFYFSALCSLSVVSLAEASKTPGSFSIDLIHCDSLLSPFYNSSMTPSHLIKNAALRSISRSNLLHFLVGEKESTETIIIPNYGEYLMKFYIGTPPVERLAIADTGSDLVWVQCSPCMSCFPQDTNLFDPNKSSTFSNVSCDSKPCTLLPSRQHRCGNSGECEYLYQYGDKSFTMGDLGVDVIKFDTEQDQGVTFPKSIFGCGFNNDFTAAKIGKITGLVGLGAGPLSLVSQLSDQIGHKFSYCLLPFSSNSTSKLKFGKEAIIKGNGVVSTPLITKPSSPTFYFLNLESIVVGQKKVQTGQTDGNIIIDSGTTLTLLEPTLYNKFVTLVKEVIEEEQNPPSPFDLCFRYKDDMNFTDIVFQFRGANVSLLPQNLLLLLDTNLLCFAIVSSNQQGFSIFGNVAQIDFQVEYDLEGKIISFAPTNCTKLG